VGLLETSTLVTWEVLSYPTFNEQLQAYCDWAESITVAVDPKPKEWLELQTYFLKGKSHPQSLQAEIQRLKTEGYKLEFYSRTSKIPYF
jgi:hypothetical protein